MAHDKNTIHVSHYQNSPTWRSAVAPEDRSWLLFVDVAGAPHLYLATETQADDGQTVTTYAPCVRATLRPQAETGAEPSPPLDTQGFTIVVSRQPGDTAHPFIARVGAAYACPGATARAAVVAALEEYQRGEVDPLRDPSVAVLAL